MIADVTIDQLVLFGNAMKLLTSPTSIKRNALKASEIYWACVLFNKMFISVKNMTFELRMSIKRP